MSVGPRRRDNPIRDWGVRLGIVAGESNGGGVGREQRRQAPTTMAPPLASAPGLVEVVNQSASLTAQTTAFIPLTGQPAPDGALVVLTIRFTGSSNSFGDVLSINVTNTFRVTPSINPSGDGGAQLILPAFMWNGVVNSGTCDLAWQTPDTGNVAVVGFAT